MVSKAGSKKNATEYLSLSLSTTRCGVEGQRPPDHNDSMSATLSTSVPGMGSTGTQLRHLEQATRMVSEGAVQSVVHDTVPLQDALSAAGWMSERKLFGRVVLLP